MISRRKLYQTEKVIVPDKLKVDLQKYLETHNLGNRGVADGNKRKQLIGLIGESLFVEKLTGNPTEVATRIDGFDGGADVEFKGKKIDVKTMERNSYVRGNYVNNFYTMQEDYDSDIIAFCSYHAGDNILEICGWMYKRKLPTIGKFYKKGTTRLRENGTTFKFEQDNYEVENKDLRPFAELLKLDQSEL